MDLKAYGKILSMFLILLLIQVMVINNINIGVWGVTPMFYTLFVLALPFETPRWVLLVFGFVMEPLP